MLVGVGLTVAFVKAPEVTLTYSQGGEQLPEMQGLSKAKLAVATWRTCDLALHGGRGTAWWPFVGLGHSSQWVSKSKETRRREFHVAATQGASLCFC